jgi:hypothetical protein
MNSISFYNVITENQLHGGSQCLPVTSHESRRGRATNAIELILSASYLLLVELVLKDWLVSSYELAYPYAASFAMCLGIILGFMALRRVHLVRLWRDLVLAASAILSAAALAELLPQKLGVLPAVAVLTCGLAGPSLLAGGDKLGKRRRYFYVAAVTTGLLALIAQPTQEPKRIFWGVIVALVTLSSGTFAVFICRCAQKVRRRQNKFPLAVKLGAALLIGGIAILFSIMMIPALSLSTGETAWLGLGFGWTHQPILETGDIRQALSTQVRVAPAVSLMIGSLVILPLLLRKGVISEWRLTRYVTAVIIGFTIFALGPKNLLGWDTWPNFFSIAKSAPLASSGSEEFVLTLLKEQGLLLVFVLGCILITAVSLGVLVLVRLVEEQEQEARMSLCAGVISTFFGMLLSVQIGPPFLTGDSVAGTWALAIAVASVGIAASRPQQQSSSIRRVYTATGIRKRRRWILVLAGFGILAFAAAIYFVSYRNTLDKIIQPFVGTAAPPGYHTFVALSSISREMQDATVAFEDPGFYQHRGFEWRGLHYALRVNLRAGQVVFGSSTITQQLAKNLFLTKDRTLRRKLKEAVVVREMERLLSKQRILEIYLNTIDYGMGQHGINAAAQYYLHKSPGELTLAESAILVGLVPHPPDQHLSYYQLLSGQMTAFQRIKAQWSDRYSDADIESAAKTPVDQLLYLRAGTIIQDSAKELPPREPSSVGTYWRNLGACFAVILLLGYGVFSILTYRAIRSENTDGLRPSLGAKTILPFLFAGLGVLTVATMHWYKTNSERAKYTIIYPYSASENYDNRPSDAGINCIVLHATAETEWGTTRWFLDPTSKTSAHLIVNKEGRIAQFVPLEYRAWHAGVSVLDGVPDVNNYSVGIEIVNLNDGMDPYPEVQYAAVAHIIRQLRTRYTIPDERIVSHRQVAPGRKSDPLGFDFEKLRIMLAQKPLE